jgi:hypothetical protein
MNRGRGVNLGVALVAFGLYALLHRSFHMDGPGAILLVVGAALFASAALHDFHGPVLPGGALMGLGAGFLLRRVLEPWMPGWATLCLGLGTGLMLASALDRSYGGQRRPKPFVPGLILVLIALVTALSEHLRLPEGFADAVWRLWPFALVVGGVLRVLQALRGRRTD